jgi:hypothetical protein
MYLGRPTKTVIIDAPGLEPPSRLEQARMAAMQYGDMDPHDQNQLAGQIRQKVDILGNQAGLPRGSVQPTSSLLEQMRQQTQLLVQMNLRVSQLEAGKGGHMPNSNLQPSIPGLGQPHRQAHQPYNQNYDMGQPPGQANYYRPPGQWHTTEPTTLSMDGLDQSTGTMARGSAAVQEVVNTVENNPCARISSFEAGMARENGALQPWHSWSVHTVADRVIDKTAGHVTLKKMLRVLAHLYETQRRYPMNPEFARAATAQALKVTLDVARTKGSWELSWPLLGLPDPEELDRHALSPAERVAVAALAKERRVLSEIAAAAKKKGGHDKTRPGDG